MNITEISTILLLISASALCIALIYFNYRIAKSVHSISLQFENYSSQPKLLINSVIELSQKMNRVTDKIDSMVNISASIVNDVRETADNILNAENKIRNGIEETVVPLVKNFQAVGKGVRSFWKNYKK